MLRKIALLSILIGSAYLSLKDQPLALSDNLHHWNKKYGSYTVILRDPTENALGMERKYADLYERNFLQYLPLQSIDSISSAGESKLFLQFLSPQLKSNFILLSEVIVSLSQNLPTTAHQPIILEKSEKEQPVFIAYLSLTDDSLRRSVLITQAKQLKKECENIAGVSEVLLFGEQTDEIQITYHPRSLRLSDTSLEFPLRHIIRALRNGKKGSNFSHFETWSQIPIFSSLIMKDFTQIQKVKKPRESFVRINGKDLVAVYIYKKSGVSSYSLSQAIRQTMHQQEGHMRKQKIDFSYHQYHHNVNLKFRSLILAFLLFLILSYIFFILEKNSNMTMKIFNTWFFLQIIYFLIISFFVLATRNTIHWLDILALLVLYPFFLLQQKKLFFQNQLPKKNQPNSYSHWYLALFFVFSVSWLPISDFSLIKRIAGNLFLFCLYHECFKYLANKSLLPKFSIDCSQSYLLSPETTRPIRKLPKKIILLQMLLFGGLILITQPFQQGIFPRESIIHAKTFLPDDLSIEELNRRVLIIEKIIRRNSHIAKTISFIEKGRASIQIHKKNTIEHVQLQQEITESLALSGLNNSLIFQNESHHSNIYQNEAIPLNITFYDQNLDLLYHDVQEIASQLAKKYQVIIHFLPTKKDINITIHGDRFNVTYGNRFFLTDYLQGRYQGHVISKYFDQGKEIDVRLIIAPQEKNPSRSSHSFQESIVLADPVIAALPLTEVSAENPTQIYRQNLERHLSLSIHLNQPWRINGVKEKHKIIKQVRKMWGMDRKMKIENIVEDDLFESNNLYIKHLVVFILLQLFVYLALLIAYELSFRKTTLSGLTVITKCWNQIFIEFFIVVILWNLVNPTYSFPQLLSAFLLLNIFIYSHWKKNFENLQQIQKNSIFFFGLLFASLCFLPAPLNEIGILISSGLIVHWSLNLFLQKKSFLSDFLCYDEKQMH